MASKSAGRLALARQASGAHDVGDHTPAIKWPASCLHPLASNAMKDYEMNVKSYPTNIKPLTSLRFFAAIWVVGYHFSDQLTMPDIVRQIFFAHGNLAVDFFFMLSGFILAHVYMPQFMAGSFNYLSFIKNRLARIYPMHVATLLASVALLVLMNIFNLGTAENNLAEASDLPAYFLMLHAWGVIDSLNFNYPSWSISAEWLAYLLFPLFMMPALFLRSRPAAILLPALALFTLLALMSPSILGEKLTELTWNFGILRILPEFAMGIGLYLLGRRHALSPAATTGIFVISLLLVFVNAALDGQPELSVLLFAMVILASAEMSRNQAAPIRFLANRSLVYLGEISYSIYLVHSLVYTVWFKGMDAVLGSATASQWQISIWVLSYPLLIVTAMAGYHLIEVPGRRFIKGAVPRTVQC